MSANSCARDHWRLLTRVPGFQLNRGRCLYILDEGAMRDVLRFMLPKKRWSTFGRLLRRASAQARKRKKRGRWRGYQISLFKLLLNGDLQVLWRARQLYAGVSGRELYDMLPAHEDYRWLCHPEVHLNTIQRNVRRNTARNARRNTITARDYGREVPSRVASICLDHVFKHLGPRDLRWVRSVAGLRDVADSADVPKLWASPENQEFLTWLISYADFVSAFRFTPVTAAGRVLLSPADASIITEFWRPYADILSLAVACGGGHHRHRACGDIPDTCLVARCAH